MNRLLAVPGCSSHINCANCPVYALAWRDAMFARLPTWHQPTIFDAIEGSVA